MTQPHSTTPPPELVQEWINLVRSTTGYDKVGLGWLVEVACRWGADAELEACCEWLGCGWKNIELVTKLRSARRSKQPSLKEQSVALLDKIQAAKEGWDISELDTIRRALEQLPDNE